MLFSRAMASSDAPLIVQGDLTVLAEVASPRFEAARARVMLFAELVKSPEHVHTYRITPLSIWNARATGMEAEALLATLDEYSRYPVPASVRDEVADQAARFGRLVLAGAGNELRLKADDKPLADEIALNLTTRRLLPDRLSETEFRVRPGDRGLLKQALIKLGHPAQDLAGHVAGEALEFALRSTTTAGERFALRAYQVEAAQAFYSAGVAGSGNSVVVLPCGAGKTIVGLASMASVGASTLILTTSTTAVRQWIHEVIDKTTLEADQVGEYSGQLKQVRPVTVATYQMLTHRPERGAAFPHLELFDSRDWGLIIYDEVHLLPAPIFQVTAELQARRRLGLTATLVREDGREDDVFALIGPKSVDVPWKSLESQGWIAKARCTEVRLPLPEKLRMEYATAAERAKTRIAAENPDKSDLLQRILSAHAGEPALVIGTYVDQLRALAQDLDAPLITGSTSQKRRDKLFEAFRAGSCPVLIVSKVANFAIDLPDAALAIQVSGSFGSRQEEAQRLGRLLRPKRHDNQAHFYSLVTRDTKEQEFAMKRQLFLCEQGYVYTILDDSDPIRP